MSAIAIGQLSFKLPPLHREWSRLKKKLNEAIQKWCLPESIHSSYDGLDVAFAFAALMPGREETMTL